MDEKVSDLIFEYFKMDVLTDLDLDEDMKREIIELFTQAMNEKRSIKQGKHNFMAGTKIQTLRNWIMEKHKGNYNPYSLKLGMLRPKLRQEACEQNISLQNYIIKLLRDRKK